MSVTSTPVAPTWTPRLFYHIDHIKNNGRASDVASGRGVYVSSRQQETDNNDKTQTQTRKETQTQAQKETEVKQNWNYNTDREDVHSLRFRADRTRVDR